MAIKDPAVSAQTVADAAKRRQELAAAIRDLAGGKGDLSKVGETVTGGQGGVSPLDFYGDVAGAAARGAHQVVTLGRSPEVSAFVQENLPRFDDGTGVQREYAPEAERAAAAIANQRADEQRSFREYPAPYIGGMMVAGAPVAEAIAGAGAAATGAAETVAGLMQGGRIAWTAAQAAGPAAVAALNALWGAAHESREGGMGAESGAKVAGAASLLLDAGSALLRSIGPAPLMAALRYARGINPADEALMVAEKALGPMAAKQEAVQTARAADTAAAMANPAPSAAVPNVGSAATRSYEPVAGAGMPVPPAPAGAAPRPIEAPAAYVPEFSPVAGPLRGPPVKVPPAAPKVEPVEVLAQRSLGQPKESYAKSLPQEYKSPDSPGGVEIIEQDFMLPVKKPNLEGEGKAARMARAAAAKRKAEIAKYWEDNPPRSVRGGYED